MTSVTLAGTICKIIGHKPFQGNVTASFYFRNTGKEWERVANSGPAIICSRCRIMMVEAPSTNIMTNTESFISKTGANTMTLHLDLDDVASGHPVAKKELARLRAVERAAQTVLDQWDTPMWFFSTQAVERIDRLRAALEG